MNVFRQDMFKPQAVSQLLERRRMQSIRPLALQNTRVTCVLNDEIVYGCAGYNAVGLLYG